MYFSNLDRKTLNIKAIAQIYHSSDQAELAFSEVKVLGRPAGRIKVSTPDISMDLM